MMLVVSVHLIQVFIVKMLPSLLNVVFANSAVTAALTCRYFQCHDMTTKLNK